MAKRIENSFTIGDEIKELFFGEKGVTDLVALDKKTIDAIIEKVDRDFKDFKMTNRIAKGSLEIDASDGTRNIRVIAKQDISGATNTDFLTIIENNKPDFLTERQYLYGGISGRFGIYQNKLTYSEQGMESSQSKEVYSKDELTIDRPIILVGDRKIYTKEETTKLDPYNILLDMNDTRQVIGELHRGTAKSSLNFIYSVGLNEHSKVDFAVPVSLKITLNDKTSDIAGEVQEELRHVEKRDIEVSKFIAKSNFFKEYMNDYKVLFPKKEIDIEQKEEKRELIGHNMQINQQQPNQQVEAMQPVKEEQVQEPVVQPMEQQVEQTQKPVVQPMEQQVEQTQEPIVQPISQEVEQL